MRSLPINTPPPPDPDKLKKWLKDNSVRDITSYQKAREAYEAQQRQEEQAQRQDKKWEDEVRDIFGEDLDDLTRNIKNAPISDPEVQKAINAISEARKAAEGGLFSRGSSKRAKKILNQNKKTIKNASNKGKKGFFDCAVIALFLLVGLGAFVASVIYGASEAVSAIWP